MKIKMKRRIKIGYMMNVPENSISVPTLGDRLLSYNISSPCPDGQRTQGKQPTTINNKRY